MTRLTTHFPPGDVIAMHTVLPLLLFSPSRYFALTLTHFLKIQGYDGGGKKGKEKGDPKGGQVKEMTRDEEGRSGA